MKDFEDTQSNIYETRPEPKCLTHSLNNFEQATSRQATLLGKKKATTSEYDKTKTVRNKHRVYET